MQYKLHALLALSLISIGAARAQTIATFDDLTLPGANTDYTATLPASSQTQHYTFQSGLVSFHGVLESWGGYGAFNYSNIADTVTESFTNDKAAVTGSGFDHSANYGIAYAPADWPAHPDESLLIGAALSGNAAGSKVAGMYVTNTTYGYSYIKNSYISGDWYKLVVRGYLNHALVQDSVVVTLADYTANDTTLIKTWEWVNLLPLGNVDSLSFQVISTDEYTPFYFAIDNVTTLDGICPVPQGIAAVSINENSATLNWNAGFTGLTTHYEIAVDQSATLSPIATAITLTANTYSANGLSPGTLYYAHIRSSCDDGSFSAWDTASFSTLQTTGIFQEQRGQIALTLSPNPATNLLSLHTTVAVDATILSIEGKQLLAEQNAKNINITSLPAGIYILKVTDTAGTGKQSTLKFIKQN